MTAPAPRPLAGPTVLFCPADRPDRYGKALAAADVVVLDLEDGVGPARKPAAREALAAHLIDPSRVIVRVNSPATADYALDLAALRATSYQKIMLPKAEDRSQAEALGSWQVVALCETPLGILGARGIAEAPNVIALMWGSEDLIAELGGTSSHHFDGSYRQVAAHARSSVLLAASAQRKLAIDSVYTNITDLEGLAAEASEAAASGFSLKACIHPSQVPVVRTAFRPGEDMVAWARRVLSAAHSGGAVAVDGQMIDAPLIRQAEAILRSVH
jgi:citrate lyase subunit beta/citryl-CoA lyase